MQLVDDLKNTPTYTTKTQSVAFILGSFFLDKHVSDLLASLMVVCHSQQQQQQSQSRATESINTASESQHKPNKHVNKASLVTRRWQMNLYKLRLII